LLLFKLQDGVGQWYLVPQLVIPALLNSSISRRIFGIVTNTGRPNSAASSRQTYLLSQARDLVKLLAINERGHPMRAALIALLLMISSQAGAEEVLYCSVDPNLSAGFVKENGQWKTSRFAPTRFQLKVNEDLGSVLKNGIEYSCRAPFSWQPNEITCENSFGWNFIYNASTKKFIFVQCSVSSYTTGDDTCSIHAGVCEAF